jgi:DNA-binding MltR family transcriptional regulator
MHQIAAKAASLIDRHTKKESLGKLRSEGENAVAKANGLTLVDYSNVVKGFHNETDRAAAVLAASFVECFLEELLRVFMHNGPVVDQLFEAHGALSTFSARSDCAYALRIIDENLHRNLKFIRQIRNHFAHHPSETSFDDSPIRDFCAHLSLGEDGESPRSTFLIAVGLAVGTMHNIMLAQEEARRRED